MIRPMLKWWVKRQLGAFRRPFNSPDSDQPLRPQSAERICVVGGGLAGMLAATLLAERGFQVTLREASGHLGGKLGAWEETLECGETVEVEHGFHAFFRNYYNLNTHLDRLNLREGWKAIDRYQILTLDGEDISIDDNETTPILNMLDLMRSGVFGLKDVLRAPTRDEMGVFLEYDRDLTFALFDDISFESFAARAELPPRLRLIFSTFSRAFFAPIEKMSLAELIKSFHFYYLSQDSGLLYDYPASDYRLSLLNPWRAYLESIGVDIQTSAPVRSVQVDAENLMIDSEPYQRLVMATDVVGTRAILSASPELQVLLPGLWKRVKGLKPSGRFAVARLWFEGTLDEALEHFVITERQQALDAIAINSEVGGSAAKWAEEHHGTVLELHCYHMPDTLRDEDVLEVMVDEFEQLIPSASKLKRIHQHLQVNANFTAFHTGMYEARPETKTDSERVVLAGDWVKLPIPAMLMEAAASSALFAVNEIFASNGVREELIEMVPPRGAMAFLGKRRTKREAKLGLEYASKALPNHARARDSAPRKRRMSG